MPSSPAATEVSSYYSAAIAALRFLERDRPTGRRFGADADARWSSFRGDLTTADRIDLMISDADAQWPGAFGARTVFAKRAVAEDEPFGADWEPLDGVDAEDVWRATVGSEAPTSSATVLQAVASAWGIKLAAHEPGAITPTDKLLVAGPSAIAAVMAAFREGADLDWSTQVTVVATRPAHRQLAALAGAMLGVTKPTEVLAAATPAKPKAGSRAIVSGDATPEDAARARELAAA